MDRKFKCLKTYTDIFAKTTVLTDLYIFLDTSWPYRIIDTYLNYVVQRLNIRPYGSSVTLLAASDGSLIVSQSYYVTEFSRQWNLETHNQAKPGFSLPIILSKALELADNLLEEEGKRNSLGLRSLIMLLMPSPLGYVNERDFDYCLRYLDFLYRTKPDMKFIYYSGGALIRFKNYVKDPREDLFPLIPEIDTEGCSSPVVERIKKEPRRITNPCTAIHTNGTRHHQQQVKQYLSLDFINFYQIAANNFFSPGYVRYIKIKAISRIAFVVCTSRKNSWPYRNSSNLAAVNQECLQISNNIFSYDLTDLCLDYKNSQECLPLFLSVQAQAFADSSQVSCQEEECFSPQEAQFLLITNNLDCSNQGQQLFKRVQLFVVPVLLNFIKLKNFYLNLNLI